MMGFLGTRALLPWEWTYIPSNYVVVGMMCVATDVVVFGEI